MTLSCNLLCICGLLRACIRCEIPTKPPGTLTQPLTLANLASGSTGRNCCSLLLTSVDWFLLLTALFSSALWPCLTSCSGLVGDHARKHFLWVSSKNRQKNLTSALLYTRKECPTSCPTPMLQSWTLVTRTLLWEPYPSHDNGLFLPLLVQYKTS